MDKSFLGITGFADVFSRFWRQKNPARLRRFAKKSAPFRKPTSGFSCPKGCEGRYCMQSIPLAVLKLFLAVSLFQNATDCMQSIPLAVLKPFPLRTSSHRRLSLHAIHTACGIETGIWLDIRSGWKTLHAIHTACGIETRTLSSHSRKTQLHAIHTACGVETKGESLATLSFCCASFSMQYIQKSRASVG